MTIRRSIWLWAGVAVAAACAGCSDGGATPLDSVAVEKALAPPAMDALRVQAGQIQHPLLEPVAFDGRASLTPDEAAIVAVLVNPSLRAARNERGIAAAQLLEAGLWPNPSLSFGMDVPLDPPPGEVIGYNLGLGWDITSLIPRRAKMDAAAAHSASVDLDIAWQEWQVAQNARVAAYRQLSISAQLAKAREVDRRLEQNLETVRKAVEEQMKTAVDLSAAEAAREEAHAAVLEQERELGKQKLALNKSLGLPPEREVPLRADVAWPGSAGLPSRQDLTAGLEERRLDLLALKRGYESQDATVRAAVLSKFPKIEVGLNHTRDSGNFFTLGPSVAIDLPIFNRNQGVIAAERATRAKLFDEYANRVFESRNEIATLLAEIESVARQVAAAEQALPVLQRLVDTYEKALANGQADILSYYTAQNDVAKKDIEILKLRGELAELRIGLEIASGRYLPSEGAAAAATTSGPSTQPGK